ncbi:diguanylate phosphodiesterase, partial [Mesorhizobium sp. M2D.F.Ca.ET.145.01.1.1]
MPVVDVKDGSVVPERAAGGVEHSRRMQDELREQNERFSAAVENMSHGLCMFDADERMIICNRNYIDIFHLDAKVMRPGIRFIDILRH